MGKFSRSPLRGEACRRIGLWILTMGTLPITLPSALLRADDRAAIDFFEKSIRPLIAERCQSCHGAAKAKAGLRLTDRESLMKGGDSGPAVVPNAPDESRLVQAVRYLGELKMPPKQKLSRPQIEALERWVASGRLAVEFVAGQPYSHDHGGFPADHRTTTMVGLPARPERAPPSVSGPHDARNEIDEFLLDAAALARDHSRRRRIV